VDRDVREWDHASGHAPAWAMFKEIKGASKNRRRFPVLP
jgi:hypothetical protein